MGKLRFTYTVEYPVDPRNYGVDTVEEAAEEDRVSFHNDFFGTLATVDAADGASSTWSVEAVG